MININSLQRNSADPWSLRKTPERLGSQLLLDVSVSDNSKEIEKTEIDTTCKKSIKKPWTFTAFCKAFWDVSKNPYIKEELEEQIISLNKEIDLLKKKCDVNNSTIVNLEKKNNDLQKKCANLERNILYFQTSSDDSLNGDSSSAESD
jgi:uncharacterized coiled-coil DUF342 family protein